MSFIVREYLEKDFEEVFSISDSVYGKRIGSFSLVSNLQDSRMLRKYVVTNEKERVIGYGLIWEQRTSPHLILKVEILFNPDYEIVEMLFNKIINDIQIIGPYAIQARTFHDQIQLLQIYEKLGFVENHRMMHVYLPLADIDLTPFVEIESKLNSLGIVVTTLAEELVSDVDYFSKLHTLNNMTWADYPTEPLVPQSSPNDQMLTHEDNIPDAYFIAKMGQLYIGHSHLMKLPSDPQNLIQGLTATLREFRGEGVATALKVKGIEFAKRMGYKGILTSTRDTNGPMEAVNRKLGWRPNYSEVRLEKILKSEQCHMGE
ncbi:GNAT family N-acetyltransferase [Paenibacillus spongiae]|uniref:GNAT family N-acetyltransferase n=1 Tax=Paenibacillus spongiae TaxID=2909671 RepID=A0ABY5S6H5_9BACL|nr:GNAT family N-acetyltransferase [Paenibacillus spongiae]UVI29264.1 GNAT family N-acetyltransferase [Paenibacillus spongiae]